MADIYQATYDAVRSRISNGDIGTAVRDSVDSHLVTLPNLLALAQGDLASAIDEMRRPSVLFRPSIAMDGPLWCALYGDNIQEGVCGFGATPDAAMRDFDAAWNRAAKEPR